MTRAPYVDRRGTKVRDWNAASTHAVGGCDVQPVRSSTDWNDPAQASTVRLVLRMPPASDIEEGDRITYDGHDYALDGAPHRWESPSGRVSHMECQLVDWRG